MSYHGAPRGELQRSYSRAIGIAPMASSRVMTRGGARYTFSSAAVVRTLLSFFSRTGFTCHVCATKVDVK